MKKALMLIALAAISAAQAQQVSIVIARDGAEPLSEAERIALIYPTEDKVAKLVEEGFQKVIIDNWGVLLIDRAAPPFRDVRIERILLTELPLDGKPVPFGSLSLDAQKALANGYGGGSLNHQFAPDTLVAFQSMANFKFTGEGRSHSPTRQLSGPSYDQIKQMSTKAAARQEPEQQERIAARMGKVRAELVFDQRQTPEAQAELYKRCTEEITKLLQAELKARDEARLRALRHLAEKHQIPDNTWTKDSIPADVLKSLSSSAAGSWAAYGFASEGAAQDWFNGSSLDNAYVSFNIMFADGAGTVSGGGMAAGMYQFGTTRR